jgi:general secretion pathway protein C
MASRIFALIVWAAVAASLAYWGLRWIARPTGVPANAMPVSLEANAQGDLHRLLAPPNAGSGQPLTASVQSALAGRLKLLGLVAPRDADSHQGVALLSIDGKPPRAIRLGGVVDGDQVLLSLTQRSASIGPQGGPASVVLDLPLLPAPATGALPPISGFSQEGAAGLQPPTRLALSQQQQQAQRPSPAFNPDGQMPQAARGRLGSPEGAALPVPPPQEGVNMSGGPGEPPTEAFN